MSSSPAVNTDTVILPKHIIQDLCPERFNGRYRDSRAEAWLRHFERYCEAGGLSETGNGRITIDNRLCSQLVQKVRYHRGDDDFKVKTYLRMKSSRRASSGTFLSKSMSHSLKKYRAYV
ncbi:hypothetical protein BGZ94_000362 [Podila epigama]|nr:hypothetical protein BGZ94_000362 [Podila epigama]